jgi:hypothetical protein
MTTPGTPLDFMSHGSIMGFPEATSTQTASRLAHSSSPPPPHGSLKNSAMSAYDPTTTIRFACTAQAPAEEGTLWGTAFRTAATSVALP